MNPNFRRLTATVLLIILYGISANAQLAFNRFLGIQVTEGNDTLELAWLGGLNCAELSDVDIDGDSIKDLVIYNKGFLERDENNNGSRFLTFKNHGTAGEIDYEYKPEWEALFPEAFYWALMVDMNCDGIEDLVSGQPGFIEYREAYRDTSGLIAFKIKRVLETESNTSLTNLFNAADNIPAFEDINGDGDMDVLAYGTFFNAFSLYENYSVETTGNPSDTVFFVESDNCWGKFTEQGVGQGVNFLGPTDTCGTVGPAPIFDFKQSRHAGVCVLMYDEDSDGDKELLICDAGLSSINRVVNWGSPDSAKCRSQDTLFPSYDVSVDLVQSVASFLVDIDNDGLRDLFVSPNAPLGSKNFDNVYYYKNVTSGDTTRFQYQQNDLFVGEMIDFGEGAYPVFFDYNGDSLLDLMVGNFGYFDTVRRYTGAIAILENVGNDTLPAFEIASRDYVDLSGLPTDSALALALADLDGDGDEDLFIGDARGTIHCFANDPDTNGLASFVLADTSCFGIRTDEFAVPYFYDIDGDTILDLLVGTRRGYIEYYQNKGTRTLPNFKSIPDNDKFGNIDASPTMNFTTQGFAAPLITTLDSTGQRYVLVGTNAGRIYVYEFDPDSAAGGTMLFRFNYYSQIDEGERIHLAVAELTGDEKLEMVIGNYRGGLSFFTQSDIMFEEPIVSIGEAEAEQPLSITVFPNPADNLIHVDWRSEKVYEKMNCLLHDVMGRSIELGNQLHQSGNIGMLTMDVSPLSTGIYYLTLYNDQVFETVRFIVR